MAWFNKSFRNFSQVDSALEKGAEIPIQELVHIPGWSNIVATGILSEIYLQTDCGKNIVLNERLLAG